ncbi:MAG TPA: SRPBCC family protein [Acidimicrobiales bacterium]|jgi:hypothetical protein
MTRLRPVGLEFLDEAPVRLDFEARVAADPGAVFAAISVDPGAWTQWFPGFTGGGYDGEGPHGVGATRRINMGETAYRETVLAWDVPTRWAYRMDESTDDTFSALVEDWVVVPDGEGAVVRWAFAVDPRPDLKEVLAGGRDFIGGVFAQAMANLSSLLAGDGERRLGPVGSRVVHEDHRIRVWELRLAPGEKSAVHRHELDHVLIQVSGDRIAVIPEPDSEGPFRDYLAADVIPGAVVSVARGGVETAHNVGAQPYVEVIVELKQ